MSVEAISWALNLAPVPADRGGQPSSACKFVLVGLANHAGPDGGGAFPSVATLVRYTGLSERTVRTCLDRLQAQLMAAALSRLGEAGFGQVILWVLDSNVRARRFYEAGGWHADGAVKQDDSVGVPMTEVRYRRSLP